MASPFSWTSSSIRLRPSTPTFHELHQSETNLLRLRLPEAELPDADAFRNQAKALLNLLLVRPARLQRHTQHTDDVAAQGRRTVCYCSHLIILARHEPRLCIEGRQQHHGRGAVAPQGLQRPPARGAAIPEEHIGRSGGRPGSIGSVQPRRLLNAHRPIFHGHVRVAEGAMAAAAAATLAALLVRHFGYHLEARRRVRIAALAPLASARMHAPHVFDVGQHGGRCTAAVGRRTSHLGPGDALRGHEPSSIQRSDDGVVAVVHAARHDRHARSQRGPRPSEVAVAVRSEDAALAHAAEVRPPLVLPEPLPIFDVPLQLEAATRDQDNVGIVVGQHRRRKLLRLVPLVPPTVCAPRGQLHLRDPVTSVEQRIRPLKQHTARTTMTFCGGTLHCCNDGADLLPELGGETTAGVAAAGDRLAHDGEGVGHIRQRVRLEVHHRGAKRQIWQA
mmetsp:Transcript_162546/g.521073  ORF Transcript_162546/g.521073 Transcript_162546/m.521073 type:complete len:447 (-) Transcript_162546:454-1794(-)